MVESVTTTSVSRKENPVLQVPANLPALSYVMVGYRRDHQAKADISQTPRRWFRVDRIQELDAGVEILVSMERGFRRPILSRAALL
jgi:hypothetical protein